MFVSLRRTQTWRLHTQLYKFGWHSSANNSRMKNSRGLILGEVFYISIIYRIQDSWLYSLNGYNFSFDLMTGENRELNFSGSKHSRPQRPRSLSSAPRIATSGQVQRHTLFEWLCKHNRLRPEPIRFVKLDCQHAQSDGKSVNRGLPVLDLARGRLLVLTKRSAASGDENGVKEEAKNRILTQ